ncbi:MULTISPECIES: helix-turn-helix transcriptional regulator [unclassified Geodermatophilus]
MLLSETIPLPRAGHRGEPAAVPGRLQAFPFGTTVLLTTGATRPGPVRGRPHEARDGTSLVALVFPHRAPDGSGRPGHGTPVEGGDLELVDPATPAGSARVTGGRSGALLVPLDRLGLPVDVVRRAAPRLRTSALHGLVRAHLQWLADDAAGLSADPGAAALGGATVELVRALVLSAAGDDRPDPPAPEDPLVTRVRAHVARYSTDPDLTPDAVARAHGVSVRHLYKALAAAGVSLEQEVIAQRLEAARTRLASPAGRQRSIAATARSCGFADPSHFARRFRRAYGTSPREWQRTAVAR